MPGAAQAALSRGVQHGSALVRLSTLALLERILAALRALLADAAAATAAADAASRAISAARSGGARGSGSAGRPAAGAAAGTWLWSESGVCSEAPVQSSEGAAAAADAAEEAGIDSDMSFERLPDPGLAAEGPGMVAGDAAASRTEVSSAMAELQSGCDGSGSGAPWSCFMVLPCSCLYGNLKRVLCAYA